MKLPLTNTRFLKAVFFTALLLLCETAGAGHLYADSMSVTITPPLFQLTIGPGDSWSSSLKIVNNNSFDMTYYAQVVDMLPNGEDGSSKFIPVISEQGDSSGLSFALARWIQIPAQPVTVKAGESAELPFTVNIPQAAEPGGHYAAILIGTEPNALHATGTVLKVSSYVSSLLFVTIKGDVTERGHIREFTTSQNLYQSQAADFLLRFENTGNTHVRPQGDITIYNMWGRQRGQVLINQDGDSNFGNVLPGSIRRFEFSWTGDGNPFDIGLYSAVVGLAYGQDGKQNVSAKVYFWVVPVVPVAIGLTVTLLFVTTFLWLIRRYIRRALLLEQKRYGVPSAVPITPPSIIETLTAPVREGVVDLRAAARAKAAAQGQPVQTVQAAAQEDRTPVTLGEFMAKYKLFLVFILLVLVAGIGLWLYLTKVLPVKRGFQITDVQIRAEDAPTSTEAGAGH